MLILNVTGEELYDEKQERFIPAHPPVQLKLEHSLISISEWEAKYQKCFLDEKAVRSFEESIYYIKCMTLNKNVDPIVYNYITQKEIDVVNAYIASRRSATWFNEQQGKGRGPSREKITSELIYYWMISNQIPFECQKWHLNRLLTLIRVCTVKNAPAKKMSKNDIMARNRAMNAKRRAAMHSRG